MTLLEALSKRCETPIVITESPWGNQGRQYRWCNGHIQTKTPEGKYWNRIINISVAILETAKAEFIHEQAEQKEHFADASKKIEQKDQNDGVHI